MANRALLAALLFALAFCVTAAPPAEYGKVELVRDTWGIPHVFADTDAGAMYGLGHATAEDRAFQMYYSLRVIQGRAAEVIGPMQVGNRRETAIDSDKKMRTFGFHRAAVEVAKVLDAETKQMLDAYCRGINDYISSNRNQLHPFFAKCNLTPDPWTPADCIASWWHLAQFFATDGTRDLLVYHNMTDPPQPGRPVPPRPRQRWTDDAAAVVQREDVSDEWVKRVSDFYQQLQQPKAGPSSPPEPSPKFSHAWVVGGKKTTTGSAVLVSDPQTPVRNPSLWTEWHVTGKSFNARGIGVAGSPMLLVGFTPNVAWGLTALGADQADLFRLQTDADHPDQYFFDNQWRKMTVLKEQINVAGGQPEEITIRLTHLGPVVTPFAFPRPGDPEVALKRIPLCEPDRDTVQSMLPMMRSQNAEEFSQALAHWRFPTANCVFGDRTGDIGYWVLGALPVRPKTALDFGSAAHDGTSSAHDWLAYIPHDLLPHSMNPARGFVGSANHRAIASFYPIPLGNSTGSMGDTLRSWRLRERLEAKNQFTPQDVLDIHHDSVNPARREFVRVGVHLRDTLQRPLSPDAIKALEQLAPWLKAGASMDLSKPGAPLAAEINTMFRMLQTELALEYGGGQTGLAHFLKTLSVRIKENPNAPLAEQERQYIDSLLANAWTSAMARYGDDPAQWNGRALQQTVKRLGAFESLDGFASLDPTMDLPTPPLNVADIDTILSQPGQSYTQFVPLHDADGAMSILPPGHSERPDAPSRTSTVELWQSKKLHPAPLSRPAVEKIARSRRVLSQ